MKELDKQSTTWRSRQ